MNSSPNTNLQKNTVKTLLSFRICSTCHPSTFLTCESITFSSTFYQDERALPGNIHSRNVYLFPSVKCNGSPHPFSSILDESTKGNNRGLIDYRRHTHRRDWRRPTGWLRPTKLPPSIRSSPRDRPPRRSPYPWLLQRATAWNTRGREWYSHTSHTLTPPTIRLQAAHSLSFILQPWPLCQ